MYGKAPYAWNRNGNIIFMVSKTRLWIGNKKNNLSKSQEIQIIIINNATKPETIKTLHYYNFKL